MKQFISFSNKNDIQSTSCVNTVSAKYVLPPIQTVKVGDIAYFQCLSTNSTHWKFNNGGLLGNVIIRGKRDESLSIFNVQLNNGGSYQCYGKDNSSFNFKAEGRLDVIGKFINIMLKVEHFII